MSGQVENNRTKFRNNVKVSERHGAGEWFSERVALGVAILAALWLAFSAYGLTGADYATVTDWFANTANPVILTVGLLSLFWFLSLAWKVIVEDYIHKPVTRSLLLSLVNVVFLVLAAASVFLIVRLALGSAPLPAGIGA